MEQFEPLDIVKIYKCFNIIYCYSIQFIDKISYSDRLNEICPLIVGLQ